MSAPFDHFQILHTAVERVRSNTANSSLSVHLMPATFTLSDLQRAYEQVLGIALDKRTFRRRVEDLGLVEPAQGARDEGAASRPAQRFRVKRGCRRELALSEKSLG